MNSDKPKWWVLLLHLIYFPSKNGSMWTVWGFQQQSDNTRTDMRGHLLDKFNICLHSHITSCTLFIIGWYTVQKNTIYYFTGGFGPSQPADDYKRLNPDLWISRQSTTHFYCYFLLFMQIWSMSQWFFFKQTFPLFAKIHCTYLRLWYIQVDNSKNE